MDLDLWTCIYMKGYEFINQLKDVTYINVIEYKGQIHKNLPCVYIDQSK